MSKSGIFNLETMNNELSKLLIKIKEYETFIDSGNYEALLDTDKYLIYIEKETMKAYGSCLFSRIQREEITK